MHDHHAHRRLLFIVVAGLFVLTAAMVFAKVRLLDFSLSDRSSVFYQLDALVSFQAAPGEPIRVSLALPELTPGYYFSPVPEGERRFRLEEQEGDMVAIAIRTEEELSAFADCQFMISKPLCLCCDDARLLEQALRLYQGRALYEGNIGEEELLPLCDRYGLII